MKKGWKILVVMLIAVCAAPAAMARSYDLNDRADEIAMIQEALDELDFYYADITGKYGTRTQAAVKKFQKRYGLPQTGTADEETLELIYEKADMEAPEIEEKQSSYGSETLREGSKSDAVRILQENLTLLEYYDGSITGSYGRLTKEAVRKFQRDNDLSADGVAGPRTLNKMTKLLAGNQTQEAPSATLSVTIADSSAAVSAAVSLEDVSLLNTEWTLRRTSRSGYVKRLQKALAALGYDPGKVDGSFGEKTETAVRLYQTARGLSSDGVAGRATLRQINEDIRDGVTAENSGVD